VVNKSNSLLDGLKYRSQAYISNANVNSNSNNNNHLNNTIPINNINVNNITNNTSELFVWPQPTTSFNVNESQLVDNTPVNKKKSTPHVSTYPLTQVTQHVDDFSPNSSHTTNSAIVLTQENIMPPDKDGKRFKCRKKLFFIFFYLKIS